MLWYQLMLFCLLLTICTGSNMVKIYKELRFGNFLQLLSRVQHSKPDTDSLKKSPNLLIHVQKYYGNVE